MTMSAPPLHRSVQVEPSLPSVPFGVPSTPLGAVAGFALPMNPPVMHGTLAAAMAPAGPATGMAGGAADGAKSASVAVGSSVTVKLPPTVTVAPLRL
jgi:hypothetical protein